MKTSLIAIFFLMFQSVAIAKAPLSLKYPLLKFSPPKIDKTVLKSGTTVFLLVDKELPLINIQVVIRTGSMFEPLGKTGLSGLAASQMRGGGTTSKSREEIDEELEFVGASVETGMGVESASASMSCLTKDFNKTLEVLFDVLKNPGFNKKKLGVHKSQIIESIRRRNDQPFGIARREYRKAVYGLNHPLSRNSEIAEIRKISRKDLIQFHQAYYKPGNMMISVSGDFEPGSMIQSLEKACVGWEPGEVSWPKVESVNPDLKTHKGARPVVYAEKDVNQSSVILGHLGIKRHNPDRFALEVMNEILGGSSFTSRLYKEIRSRLGLAYWVGTSFSEPWDLGTIAAACQTKSSSLGQTVQSILKEVERIKEEKVSEKEINLARDSIINSFVFKYGSASAIVNQRMSLEYYGFPEDYMETYTDKIRKVSIKDVLNVAQKYLHPKKMKLVIVGNQKDFDVKLEEFGVVQKVDLTIPQ